MSLIARLILSPSSCTALLSRFRAKLFAPLPALPPLAIDVTPLMRKRSSAASTAFGVWGALVPIFVWSRRPFRQSWRCSKRSSVGRWGGLFANEMWSCGLMSPGDTTASVQAIFVAVA